MDISGGYMCLRQCYLLFCRVLAGIEKLDELDVCKQKRY